MIEFIIIVFLLILLLVFSCWICSKFRRITSLKDLPSKVNGTKLSGVATYIFDGDGFKFFHVPFCRSSSYTDQDGKLSIRLAGIDAPESAALGKPGQPFATKSKNELMKLIIGKTIEIKLLGIDRYNRLLAMCYVKDGFSTINVNMKMVELGMACVYKGGNAAYDNQKNVFIRLETIAKEKKLGIFSQSNYISPMDFKRMQRQ